MIDPGIELPRNNAGFERATERKFRAAFAKLKANPWQRRTLRRAFRKLAARPRKRLHKPDSGRKTAAPNSGRRTPTRARPQRRTGLRDAGGGSDGGSDPPHERHAVIRCGQGERR